MLVLRVLGFGVGVFGLGASECFIMHVFGFRADGLGLQD